MNEKGSHDTRLDKYHKAPDESDVVGDEAFYRLEEALELPPQRINRQKSLPPTLLSGGCW